MFAIEITPPGSVIAQSIVASYLTEVASRWYRRTATPGEVEMALQDEPYDDLQGDTGVFLVAKDGGEAIACAGARFADGFAELTKVFTVPAHRGEGAGTRLLQAVQQVCWDRGIRVLRLDTRADLEEACALYERLGFVQTEAFNDESYSDRWYVKNLNARPAADLD